MASTYVPGTALPATSPKAAVAYRPPQWARGPAMVSITQVPTQGQAVGNVPGALPVTAANYVPGTAIPVTGPLAGTQTANFVASGSTQTTYVFDAVLELEHDQRLEKTRHPVQTGADISSHAYLMPPRLVLFIGMSDAMDAYASGANNANTAGSATPDNVTPFSGSSTSKSVNAYQTLISLQLARQPLTVTTRLRTYANMLITSINPREDYKTIAGLRVRVEFEQIFTATTAVSAVTSPLSSLTALSARPDATQQTGLGQVNPSAVPSITQRQFQYPPVVAATPSGPVNAAIDVYNNVVNVPGAGFYSSVVGQTTVNALGAVLP